MTHAPAPKRVVALLAVALALLVAVVPAAAAAPPGAPRVDAAAYIVESSVDGRTLAARNADVPRPMASITKLMTALVARERTRLDDTVVVPAAATRIGESTVGLRAGQRISVRDLLIATLVPSANDAATALAIHAGGGSLRRFVASMNARARELGLTGTRFRNPHGLDAPGHAATARDLAHLLRVALRDPVIRRYARAPKARLSDGTVLESTDNLAGRVNGLIGGKTGHTSDAGWSQVVEVRQGGVAVTVSVLGEPSELQRDRDLTALIEWGLAQYRSARVVDATRSYASATVGWGLEPVALVAPRSLVRPSPTSRPLVETVVAPVAVSLPVRAGQRLGEVVVRDGGRVVARSPLVAARSVANPGWLDRARFVATRTVDHLVGLVR